MQKYSIRRSRQKIFVSVDLFVISSRGSFLISAWPQLIRYHVLYHLSLLSVACLLLTKWSVLDSPSVFLFLCGCMTNCSSNPICPQCHSVVATLWGGEQRCWSSTLMGIFKMNDCSHCNIAGNIQKETLQGLLCVSVISVVLIVMSSLVSLFTIPLSNWKRL